MRVTLTVTIKVLYYNDECAIGTYTCDAAITKYINTRGSYECA